MCIGVLLMLALNVEHCWNLSNAWFGNVNALLKWYDLANDMRCVCGNWIDIFGNELVLTNWYLDDIYELVVGLHMV